MSNTANHAWRMGGSRIALQKRPETGRNLLPLVQSSEVSQRPAITFPVSDWWRGRVEAPHLTPWFTLRTKVFSGPGPGASAARCGTDWPGGLASTSSDLRGSARLKAGPRNWASAPGSAEESSGTADHVIPVVEGGGRMRPGKHPHVVLKKCQPHSKRPKFAGNRMKPR